MVINFEDDKVALRLETAPVDMKLQPKLVVSADIKQPTPVDPKTVDCNFGIGSVVKVPYEGKGIYGMVKWMGYILDKSKIIVGIESVSI